MNKILEEFKRIKTARNQFVNETNKKGEILLTEAKNKFDSVHNSIEYKNINNKYLEEENEYLDLIKMHLSKANNLNEELLSCESFINNCFQELILLLEIKIKDFLNKHNENINEGNYFEDIQNIIKLAQLTKILVEENMTIIKGDSNMQRDNLLIQIKDNYNIIYNNLFPDIISNNNINKKSIIDNISKILNAISENIILIYNDINSNLFNNLNEEKTLHNYFLNLIFNNNSKIYNNVSNSKIWKIIITKNNNKEITLSQSIFKVEKNKKFKKIPKNYSIHIFIEKSSNINKTIKLMKYMISLVKNRIMTYYVITNNFKSKLEGYYCFEIFGIGKRKRKIIQTFKNKIENINKKVIYNDICLMVKISLYNDIDLLMKKKFFNLLKKEFKILNYKTEDNKNIININYLKHLVENDIHYNFNNDLIKYYLNPNNMFEEKN